MATVIRKEPAMPALMVIAPLALLAAPVAAAEPQDDRDFEIPSALTDPAMAETLGRMLGAMTKVMMDMPVGEMQAAVEGREPTAADKNRTLRDMTGRDLNFERNVERQVAEAVPRMQASMRAMAGPVAWNMTGRSNSRIPRMSATAKPASSASMAMLSSMFR